MVCRIKIVSLCAALIFGAALSALAQVAWENTTLVKKLESSSVNLSVRYYFVNRGTSAIAFKSAVTSCQCLSVNPPETRVPSGETGVIEVHYTRNTSDSAYVGGARGRVIGDAPRSYEIAVTFVGSKEPTILSLRIED